MVIIHFNIFLSRFYLDGFISWTIGSYLLAVHVVGYFQSPICIYVYVYTYRGVAGTPFPPTRNSREKEDRGGNSLTR